jgi:hypothetical protein
MTNFYAAPGVSLKVSGSTQTCKDTDATICPRYATAGYCSTYTSVRDYCPFSCNACSQNTQTSPTTPPTTPPTTRQPFTASECKDSDTNLCTRYAANGYCASYTSVQQYCPLSCKKCSSTQTQTPTQASTKPSTTTTLCQDSDSNTCFQYATKGYCASYTSVQQYCPLSCKICTSNNSSTTMPAQTSTSKSCKDMDSNTCSQYATKGYCATYTSVQQYCPLSCKICFTSNSSTTTMPAQTSTSKSCKDADTDACTRYAAYGYCASYLAVQQYCPSSCKSCT